MRTLVPLLTLLCLAGPAIAVDEAAVKIEKFAFTPKEIDVKVGTRVVWINHDETPHAILSQDKEIKSSALDTDDKY